MQSKAHADAGLLNRLVARVSAAYKGTSSLPAMTQQESERSSVATLVHELRNSLATISNLVSYLDARLKAQPDTELQRVAGEAMGQVRQMSHLIDHLSNSEDHSS